MKKEYMKPAMQVVNIAKLAPILAASTEGMNRQLQNEEVEYGW